MLIAAIASSAWFGLAGTPEYSLYQLSHAIRARDVKSAERYLDVESVATDAAEASIEYLRSNQGEVTPSSDPWGQFGQAFAQGLIELMLPAIKIKIEDGIKESIRNAISEGQTSTRLLTVPTTVWDLRSKMRVEHSGSTATLTVYEGSKVVSKFKMARQSDRTWKIMALDRQWLLSYLRQSSPPISAAQPFSPAPVTHQPAAQPTVDTVAQMRRAVGVRIISKGFEKADYQTVMHDGITFSCIFRNTSSKDIRGFRGVIEFNDIFGAEIKSIRLSYDEGLKAGEQKTWNGVVEYNPFMGEDRKLRDTSLENLQVEWKPQTILFTEGTKLGE